RHYLLSCDFLVFSHQSNSNALFIMLNMTMRASLSSSDQHWSREEYRSSSFHRRHTFFHKLLAASYLSKTSLICLPSMQSTIRALPTMSRWVIADLESLAMMIVYHRAFAALPYRLFASGLGVFVTLPP